MSKTDLIHDITACLVPADKKRTGAVYDMKTNEKIREYDFVEEYEVYIVNNSDDALEKIHMLVGGFASSDDDLIETSKNIKNFGTLGSKKALLLETLDFGMLDFTNWYHLDLYPKGKDCLKIWFEFRGHILNSPLKKIPVINKEGYVIEIKPRDTEAVDEEAKKLNMDSVVHKYSEDNDTSTQLVSEPLSPDEQEEVISADDVGTLLKIALDKNSTEVQQKSAVKLLSIIEKMMPKKKK